MRREILIAVMLMSAGGGAQSGTQLAEQCPAPGMSFEADVSGQIVDDQGRPVPRVEIWSVQPERRDGVFPKALSGPDGRFSLPRPVPGSEGYLVTCPAGFRREQVNVDDLPSGQPLRLPLRRVGRIVGRVVDPDGEPVAGAKVFAQIPGTVFSYVCSNGAPPPLPCSPKTGVSAEAGETGRFAIDSVEPGWYEVSAEGAGLFQQAPRRMLVTSGRTLEPEIVIGQGPVLSGRLFSADGAPLAKASVQLVESREPEWDRVWRTMTDAQGRFHFRGVAAGERRVRAAVEGRGTAQRRVRIGAGETRVDLRLAPDREIRGRVVDAGGAPIERAEIYGEQPFRFSFPTFTDEDGRFSRRLRAEDDEIEVRKSGFVTARSAIHPEIEIVLEPVDETHLR